MRKGIQWLLSGAGILLLAVSSASYNRNNSAFERNLASNRTTGTKRPARQAAANATSPARDTQALTLANQALTALTGGVSVTDATVQAGATLISGSDQESGSASFEARTGYESRIVLTLSGGAHTEIRNGSNAPPQGKWSGPDGSWQIMPLHKCWVDPTWFFPALTIQSAVNDGQTSVVYMGADTKSGVSVQHIQISRLVPGQIANATLLIQRLSRADIYIDSGSYLPVIIDFNEHPDFDAGTDVPVEIKFSGWQALNGIQTPSRVQKFSEGTLSLELNSIVISVNTGIPQSDFTI